MKPLKTHAVVLRRIDYGEADRIVTVLSDGFGKIRVMAKGVRKSRSKLAGGIEVFSVSELQFLKGRRDIGTLISARMVRHYGSIVKDLKRTEQAYAMLKAMDRTLEDDTGQEYFEVIDESLAALDKPAIPAVLTEVSFAMRVLQLLGHVPDFATNANGGRLDPDDVYEFDYEAVAFKPATEGKFDKNHLKVLKLLAYNNPQKMSAVQGIGKYVDDLAPLIRALAAQYIPA